MSLEKFPEGINNFPGFKPNHSLKSSSWMGVGGVVDGFFKPRSVEALAEFLKILPSSVLLYALGAISNTLIPDSGFRGVAVRPHFTQILKIKDNEIQVGAGVLTSTLAMFAANLGFLGFEFFATIPGTVGGALAMNAGCFGSCTKDLFVSAKALDRSGNLVSLSVGDMGFGYRKVSVSNMIFCSAVFRAQGLSEPSAIMSNIDQLILRRKSSQPGNCKTLGSTFCNPTGSDLKVWQLLESVGLRGYKIGGAKFSEKHINFVINEGNAQASDVIDLINEATRRVREKFGINLEQEIRVMGKVRE